MRPSQRRVLLDAALDVVAAEEGADITLDAVARRAGLSKPGLTYHFPTREALLLALVEHAAERVEAALLEQLGRPFEQATAAERHRAHVRVTAGEQVSRAEYAVYAEASYHPALTAPQIERMARWFDLPPGTPPATRARLTAARLAADGLWAAAATGVLPVDPGDRAAVLAALDALTRDVADHSERTAP